MKKRNNVFPLVISFYTKELVYQMGAHNLAASCEQFAIECSIEGIDSFGSWELNCAYKPFFIAEKLKQFQRPVLWVDADAIFVRKPTMLTVFEKDLAAYTDASLNDDHPSKTRSGTVYVNATPHGMELVQLWALECQKQLTDPHRTDVFWDQIALRNVVVSRKEFTGVLPLSYIKIFDHLVDQARGEEPVITHFQASRSVDKSLSP